MLTKRIKKELIFVRRIQEGECRAQCYSPIGDYQQLYGHGLGEHYT